MEVCGLGKPAVDSACFRWVKAAVIYCGTLDRSAYLGSYRIKLNFCSKAFSTVILQSSRIIKAKLVMFSIPLLSTLSMRMYFTGIGSRSASVLYFLHDHFSPPFTRVQATRGLLIPPIRRVLFLYTVLFSIGFQSGATMRATRQFLLALSLLALGAQTCPSRSLALSPSCLLDNI